MRNISRTTILPKFKALMGAVDTTCPDPIAYLLSLGFDEHSADSLYNGHSCKDIFTLLLIVVIYRFVESLPRPRGVTGVPIALEFRVEVVNVVPGTDPVAMLRSELLQMMREMQTTMMAHITIVP